MSAQGIVTAEQVSRELNTEASRVVYEVTHGDGWDHGTHWVWLHGRELYTAAGLQRIIDALREHRHDAMALALTAWLPTPEPPMQKPADAVARAVRSHLPYADEDDAAIFNQHQK